ncbi:hypothetical protein AX14_010462 [Amanita brunnescens Koide BX004]|nr:hypothetical protein AX14_010462 [Amanita brunnescens Koide BX004]
MARHIYLYNAPSRASTAIDGGCHVRFSQEREGEIPMAEAKKGAGASPASNFVFLSTPFQFVSMGTTN